MNLNKLKEPFSTKDLEHRLARSGKSNNRFWGMVLTYINARAVQDRLDDVVGPENWRTEYSFLERGVLCRLYIKVGSEWISKEDVNDYSDIEALKGGVSGALKRAAAVWGIGRYLYNLKEGFATIVDRNTEGAFYGQTKEKEGFNWLPPQLPDWALPENERNQTTHQAEIIEEVPAVVEAASGPIIAKKSAFRSRVQVLEPATGTNTNG